MGIMNGEIDLHKLLGQMNPRIKKEEYVYCVLPSGYADWPSLKPMGWFVEEEGITLILEKKIACQLNLAYDFPCRLITLNVHSSLSAVGLLAAVTARLAESEISVNVISAFYHDHLLVPAAKAEESMRILNSLAKSMTASPSR
jgi:hypothetical protein